MAAWIDLDHGNEWLAAWREGVANEAKAEAERWVDVFIDCALIFVPLHRT